MIPLDPSNISYIHLPWKEEDNQKLIHYHILGILLSAGRQLKKGLMWFLSNLNFLCKAIWMYERPYIWSADNDMKAC